MKKEVFALSLSLVIFLLSSSNPSLAYFVDDDSSINVFSVSLPTADPPPSQGDSSPGGSSPPNSTANPLNLGNSPNLQMAQPVGANTNSIASPGTKKSLESSNSPSSSETESELEPEEVQTNDTETSEEGTESSTRSKDKLIKNNIKEKK